MKLKRSKTNRTEGNLAKFRIESSRYKFEFFKKSREENEDPDGRFRRDSGKIPGLHGNTSAAYTVNI